mgnify:CR=1 FL=1
MKGLELARYYYETAGKQALERQVPNLVPRLAIGLKAQNALDLMMSCPAIMIGDRHFAFG